MRHLVRFSRKPIRRYAVVLAVVAAPLLVNYANVLHDETAPQVLADGVASSAPDHAMLMRSDVERALPASPRVAPDALNPTML